MNTKLTHIEVKNSEINWQWFVSDLLWSRVGKSDYELGGLLHSSQRRMQMVGRVEEVKGPPEHLQTRRHPLH